MSVSPFVLSRPIYALSNVLSTTLSTRDPEGAPDTLLAIIEFLVPVTILLDNYLEQIYNGNGRSLGEEQAGAYAVLAGRLSAQFGVDGAACLQRFVCELQQRPIHGRTMAGRMLTMLLTPRVRSKRDATLLTDYLAAGRLGQRGAYCDHHYAACPFSAFHYFDDLRNATARLR
ncbi:uncharacterized protein LOC126986040 [Eriocheir sinensis]|uniref:uncharacterized protein LOC126986040 n=1 Tax=Eriocheir sinensis TaxID=95602 RepID=UPI0021C6B932|nr:uncharacterized protein LOC126986040 [Eriocheir sinensis]